MIVEGIRYVFLLLNILAMMACLSSGKEQVFAMNTLTLTDLEAQFNNAVQNEHKFFGAVVKLPNGAKEVIINNAENFEYKLDYYKDTYNQELLMKNVKTISIVDFASADSFAQLQKALNI